MRKEPERALLTNIAKALAALLPLPRSSSPVLPTQDRRAAVKAMTVVELTVPGARRPVPGRRWRVSRRRISSSRISAR